MDENRTVSTRQGLIYENGGFHPEERTLVREEIWRVTVNGREAGSFACSPVQMQDAAVGFLFLNVMLASLDELKSLELLPESREIRAAVRMDAKCPDCRAPAVKICAAKVEKLLSWLENQREKGVHSCALIQGENLVFRSDVSRGTAVDKAAGACLRQGIETENTILVFSGRVPEGIVTKCARMGCKLIVARSGPTDLACELAEKAGITIVGHAGPGRFCVYTCPERMI